MDGPFGGGSNNASQETCESIRKTLMLEWSASELAVIGLFFLSLLFLPISRGYPLLRLIDIPFEHAIRYRVWLGHLTMTLFTLHGLLYTIAWELEGKLLKKNCRLQCEPYLITDSDDHSSKVWDYQTKSCV